MPAEIGPDRNPDIRQREEQEEEQGDERRRPHQADIDGDHLPGDRDPGPADHRQREPQRQADGDADAGERERDERALEERQDVGPAHRPDPSGPPVRIPA